MFNVMFILFAVIFVVALVATIAGMFFHFSMVGKIFSLASKEIERRAEEAAPPDKVPCGHCGTTVTAGQECPNCGATS